MPWKVSAMSVQRSAFLTDVSDGQSVSAACRVHGISRKTGYKWIKRFRANPLAPLSDRSRKPARSPLRASPLVVDAVLQLRDRFGWGPQKIRDHFNAQPLAESHPSERTLANILVRHNRVIRVSTPQPLPQSFERSFPNQLWQVDFKGTLEVGRQRVTPFVVIDDHSRYLLALKPCMDKSTRSAWDVLWDLFDRHGIPDAVLSDNAFAGQRHPAGLSSVSWIEMCLIRAGVKPIHGRPYHPQTQGKVERINGTIERELFPKVRKDALDHFETDCDLWRTTVYNTFRPHESLGGRTPVSRWMPSSKKRPAKLPEVSYPAGSLLRKVCTAGDISWNGYRILGGQGLAGQLVRVALSEHDLQIFFGDRIIRKIPFESFTHDKVL